MMRALNQNNWVFFKLQLVIASVVIGTISVTALAYLDLDRKIDHKQDQIDDINTRISAQDKLIESLSASVSALSNSIGAIEVRKYIQGHMIKLNSIKSYKAIWFVITISKAI